MFGVSTTPLALVEQVGPAVAAVLFVAASFGHGLVAVAHVNWWYAHPIDHRLLSVWRKLHAVAVLVGWLLFALYAYRAEALADWPIIRHVVAVYFSIAAIVGLVVFPIVCLRRWTRPRPTSLAEECSHVVDVASAVGYQPLGTATNRWMARLPKNQTFEVDFSQRTLILPRLPLVWNGLTILHLSDLHLRGCPDRRFYQFVLERCRQWDADLVVLTGDVVDSPTHHRLILPLLGQLHGKHGSFAILGNHDAWYDPDLIRRRLRRAGYDVLGNGWTERRLRGERLLVIGNEAPWFRPAPTPPPVDAAFRLCLSHSPDQVAWARRHGVDLLLAGHVHGGQIRFPPFGSLFVPSRYGRRYDCGVFDEPPTLLHVSRGLGGQHPLRYNCRPEVTLLTLRPRVAPPLQAVLPDASWTACRHSA
jgi:predicted MPP superfamily phosphohydrolase